MSTVEAAAIIMRPSTPAMMALMTSSMSPIALPLWIGVVSLAMSILRLTSLIAKILIRHVWIGRWLLGLMRHHATLVEGSVVRGILLVEWTRVPLTWSVVESWGRWLSIETLVPSVVSPILLLRRLLPLVTASTLIVVLYSPSLGLEVLSWIIGLLLEA